MEIATTFNCPNCDRSYKRKIYYDRHLSACSLLSQNKHERADDIEKFSDTPSMRSLYEMIMTLARRNEDLERKVEDLSKWAAIRKKRIHVTEWLDHTYCDVPTFDDYIFNIHVTNDDLELIWKYDHVEGITHIIRQWFPLETEERLPLRAFDQKDNTFFVKTHTGWITMPVDTFEILVGRVCKELMCHFVKWQEENRHRIERDDYATEYTTKLQKVIGGNFTREQTNNRIRKNIYKYMKTNLKDVVQFEFTT